jgi:hypothetical protein
MSDLAILNFQHFVAAFVISYFAVQLFAIFLLADDYSRLWVNRKKKSLMQNLRAFGVTGSLWLGLGAVLLHEVLNFCGV